MKAKLLLLFFIGFITYTNAQTTLTCGSVFTDNGGPNANYTNNANITYTVCPTAPNQVATVNFISFDVENNFDALYIYNGNSATAPLISSGNLSSTNLPAGGFWGNQLQGMTITSTSNDGDV